MFTIFFIRRSRSASKVRKSHQSDEGALIGNKNEEMCFDNQGHMCQALISDDGVVLDLEDCCNMTVCEKV